MGCSRFACDRFYLTCTPGGLVFLHTKVYLGAAYPEAEERTFEKYPKRQRGQYGRKTDTGHMPPHAEAAREKLARR